MVSGVYVRRKEDVICNVAAGITKRGFGVARANFAEEILLRALIGKFCLPHTLERDERNNFLPLHRTKHRRTNKV